MGLRRSLEMLGRRKWWILGCGIVVGSLVGGLSAREAPTYSAQARIQVRTGPLGVTPSDRAVNARVDAITDEPVLTPVASRLGHTTTARVRDAIAVDRVGDAVIAITATGSTRAHAARIANAVARTAIEVDLATQVRDAQTTVADLDAQLAGLQARTDALDEQIGSGTPSAAQSAQFTAMADRTQAAQDHRQRLQHTLDVGPTASAIVAPARAADAERGGDPVRDGLLAGVLALLVAAAAAWTIEVLGDRVRSADELGRMAGLPILAELPLDPRSKKDRRRIAVSTSPRSPLGEATRALRTSIELHDVEHPSPTLLVTSAVSGEGKSLVSANLAAAYALAGSRTVLVDGDLRTPHLSSVFGTYPAPLLASGEAVHGLSTLVSESTVSGADRPRLEQAALLRTPIQNLLFLPAGPAPANPSDLLDSRAMDLLLGDLAAIADVVIIDAPPLLPVSDAAGLARRADAVVLVGAIGSSRRREVRRARRVLDAHPGVLGAVANQVAPGTAYVSHRRTAKPLSPAKTPRSPALTVMRRLEVPPPSGVPDANGDIWIDLSDDADDQRLDLGSLQVSSWGR